MLAYRKDHTYKLVTVKERRLPEVGGLVRMARLHHDNVALLHEVYHCSGVAYFLYEDIKLTLLDIQRGPGLSLAETEIAAILSQVSLYSNDRSREAETYGLSRS